MNRTRSLLLAAGLGALGACGGSSSTEALKQPTTFTVKVTNIAPWKYLKSGTYSVPVGHASAGPLHGGDRYEVVFTAGKGQRLSFASMLGISNDWFFGSDPAGIALYDAGGDPISGDVTAQVHLYNAGTEIDEEPGVGPDTGPKQSTPDQGAPDPDPTVREIESSTTLSDGSSFSVPPVEQMIRVSLTPTGNEREFKLTIENVSQPNTFLTSQGYVGVGISPGVYVIHAAANPLYTLGQPDRGEGLELIAESGRIATLAGSVAKDTGAATPFSPLVWAVHDQAASPIFLEGLEDRGQGLELVAESGRIANLKSAIASVPGVDSSGGVDTPDGASSPGALTPGASYTFQITARPGERLSIASMFGMSDDWFVGFGDLGVKLFGPGGTPVNGDVSSSLALFDSGTEQNEELAIGPDTGPQQGSPDQGPADPNPKVRRVSNDEYPVSMAQHLMVTITPN